MAGTKAKKMKASQMKKELRRLSKEELAGLLEGMYASCPEAVNYLNMRLAKEEFEKAFLAESKEKVRDSFFTKKGNARLKYDSAMEAIAEFEKALPSAESIIDLKLYYVENGMEIVEGYNSIPDKLYKAIEQMFEAVVEDINAIENEHEARSLAVQFYSRLSMIGSESGPGDPWFHMYMHELYDSIRWLDMPQEITKGIPEDEEGFPPITDFSNNLPEEDGALFYRLFLPLLNYVNEKLHINELRDIDKQDSLNPEKVKEIANVLWDDTSLIDEYIELRKTELPKEHQAVLKGWKRCIKGRFIIERDLKNGSILISLDDNRVFLVRGIITSLEEMMMFYPYPLPADAVLLPYRGVIITDGLLTTMNIFFGSNLKKQMKDLYMNAKRRNQIITSL